MSVIETRDKSYHRHEIHAETLGDLLSYARPLCKKGEKIEKGPYKGLEWYDGVDVDTYEEIFDLASGVWAEGMERVAKLRSTLESTLPRPISIRRRRAWVEDSGDSVSTDRLYSGQPYWEARTRQPRRGPKQITICTDSGTPGSKTGEELAWRSICALVMADALEDAGYRVRILVYRNVTGCFTRKHRDCGSALYVAQLKSFSQSLSIPTLVAGLSAWAYRTLWWKLMDGYAGPSRVSDDKGMPSKLNNLDLERIAGPDALHCKGVWSLEDAKQWLEDAMKTFD